MDPHTLLLDNLSEARLKELPEKEIHELLSFMADCKQQNRLMREKEAMLLQALIQAQAAAAEANLKLLGVKREKYGLMRQVHQLKGILDSKRKNAGADETMEQAQDDAQSHQEKVQALHDTIRKRKEQVRLIDGQKAKVAKIHDDLGARKSFVALLGSHVRDIAQAAMPVKEFIECDVADDAARSDLAGLLPPDLHACYYALKGFVSGTRADVNSVNSVNSRAGANVNVNFNSSTDDSCAVGAELDIQGSVPEAKALVLKHPAMFGFAKKEKPRDAGHAPSFSSKSSVWFHAREMSKSVVMRRQQGRKTSPYMVHVTNPLEIPKNSGSVFPLSVHLSLDLAVLDHKTGGTDLVQMSLCFEYVAMSGVCVRVTKAPKLPLWRIELGKRTATPPNTVALIQMLSGLLHPADMGKGSSLQNAFRFEWVQALCGYGSESQDQRRDTSGGEQGSLYLFAMPRLTVCARAMVECMYDRVMGRVLLYTQLAMATGQSKAIGNGMYTFPCMEEWPALWHQQEARILSGLGDGEMLFKVSGLACLGMCIWKCASASESDQFWAEVIGDVERVCGGRLPWECKDEEEECGSATKESVSGANPRSDSDTPYGVDLYSFAWTYGKIKVDMYMVIFPDFPVCAPKFYVAGSAHMPVSALPANVIQIQISDGLQTGKSSRPAWAPELEALLNVRAWEKWLEKGGDQGTGKAAWILSLQLLVGGQWLSRRVHKGV